MTQGCLRRAAYIFVCNLAQYFHPDSIYLLCREERGGGCGVWRESNFKIVVEIVYIGKYPRSYSMMYGETHRSNERGRGFCGFSREFLPVIGGGSTTVEGPKKVETSAEVVTGVFRSPGAVSELSVSFWVLSGTPEAGMGLVPPFVADDSTFLYSTESKLKTLKRWAAAAAAASDNKNGCECAVVRVSKPSMIMVVAWFSVVHLAVFPPEDRKSQKK